MTGQSPVQIPAGETLKKKSKIYFFNEDNVCLDVSRTSVTQVGDKYLRKTISSEVNSFPALDPGSFLPHQKTSFLVRQKTKMAMQKTKKV